LKGEIAKLPEEMTISKLRFPLFTVEEQQQIVHGIESRLSVCDKIEETITDSVKQAEALRQSILKKAFGGEFGVELLY
jgi:type I restriction enzyme, S subunit